MTHVAVLPGAEWIPADLAADPDAWARATVQNRLRTAHRTVDPIRLERLTAGLAAVIRHHRAEPRLPTLVLLLCPEPDEPAVTSVAVREWVPTGVCTARDLTHAARLTQARHDECVVPTAAGEAIRLRQRFPPWESLLYAWLLDDGAGPLAVTLSTVFAERSHATRWRGAVDALARSAHRAL